MSAAMFQILVHRHQSEERKSILAIPSAQTGLLPLILMLHGTGGTAAWTMEETGWVSLAQEEGFCLLFPEGTRSDPTAPPGFLTNPLVWNDGGTRPGLGDSDADDVGYLHELMERVVRDFPIDPQRIYCTGFSNGAGMTFRLAAERPHLLAAIAPVAGLCSIPDPIPKVSISTLYLTGTNDPLIPVEGGEVRFPWGNRLVNRPSVRNTLNRWAQALDCQPTPRLVEVNPSLRVEAYPSDDVEFQVWWIEGQGHHWPGGRGGVSQRICGPMTQDIQANRVIWDFFQSLKGHDRRRKT